jgi:hypothetical protein
MIKTLLVALFLCLLTPRLTWAITVTLGENTTNTFASTKNRLLKESTPSTGYTSSLEVSHYAAGDYSNTTIKVSLASITGPITVTSATLFLYQDNQGGSSTLEARRLLRDWYEPETNWDEWSSGNAWTTGGARSNGNDRIATVSGTTTPPATSGVWVSFTGAGMATDVQNWVNDSTTYPNYGWVLERQGIGEDAIFHHFISTQGSDGQRPYLQVIYTTGSGAVVRRRVVVVQ